MKSELLEKLAACYHKHMIYLIGAHVSTHSYTKRYFYGFDQYPKAHDSLFESLPFVSVY